MLAVLHQCEQRPVDLGFERHALSRAQQQAFGGVEPKGTELVGLPRLAHRHLQNIFIVPSRRLHDDRAGPSVVSEAMEPSTGGPAVSRQGRGRPAPKGRLIDAMDNASKLAASKRHARHLRRSYLSGFSCGRSERPDAGADWLGTPSADFTITGRNHDLGKPGQMFRTTMFGRPSTSGPGQFVIAGYTTGMAAPSR
jgi:hypothetical protein